MYSIKQLAELAQISVRTLHYYDEIGLLRPARNRDNGYRRYDDAALLRLQQILTYRALGLELGQIKDLLDDPHFDVVETLREQRIRAQAQMAHFAQLISTIDETIEHLTEGKPMSKKQLFQPFSEEKQRQYEREIRLEYGLSLVQESRQNWASYDQAQRQAILDEGNALYSEIAQAIEDHLPATSEAVQALMVRWHEHLRYFYEPPLEVLRGLGDLYTTHPDFIANFAKLHPRLGDFMKEAIAHYVDALETRELERLLAEDDTHSKRLSE